MEEYSKAFQEKNIDGHELLGLNGARLKVGTLREYFLYT